MLWDICKESPNYSKYARLAAHLLGYMFTGARYYACRKCGQENAAQTKHLLMFCRCKEEFRVHLWRKLIIRFGLGFFNLYIALPTDEQLALLFQAAMLYYQI